MNELFEHMGLFISTSYENRILTRPKNDETRNAQSKQNKQNISVRLVKDMDETISFTRLINYRV